jgi:hypothetical protein
VALRDLAWVGRKLFLMIQKTKLNDELYSSPDNISVAKKRKMVRWAGHITLKGNTKNNYKILI